MRQRAPRAQVLFVDYLTVLPPAGQARTAAVGHRRRARPPHRRHARAADRRSRRGRPDANVVRAAEASREHHAWSADPWTTKPTRFGLPIPGRPVPRTRTRRACAPWPTWSLSEQEIRAAFADHDRRRVGVGARNPRQRRGVGDAEVFDTADPQLLVERRCRARLPIATLQDGWNVVIAVSLMQASMSAPGPGRISRSTVDAIGSVAMISRVRCDRPDERFDVLALGEQVHPDGRWRSRDPMNESGHFRGSSGVQYECPTDNAGANFPPRDSARASAGMKIS